MDIMAEYDHYTKMWVADDLEGEGIRGYGKTEEEAISHVLWQFEEKCAVLLAIHKGDSS